MSTKYRWLMVALLVAGAGCDGGKKGDKACDEDEACGSSSAALTGRVLDANEGRAVKGAELKASSATTSTDSQGRFELKAGESAGEVAVSKQDYVATKKGLPSQGGYVEVFIKSVDLTQDFDAETGVTVTLESGVSLTIPGNSVVDAEGKTAKGKLKLAVADVDGKVRTQAAALPGELRGETKAGDKGIVSVERALDITITNAEGKKLQVDAKADAVAEFPSKEGQASERSALSFDEMKGAWIEEDKITRAENGKGEPVYRKDIDHLSWHGYGDFFGELTCVTACVVDTKDKPLPGAQIWLVGKSFAGVSTLFASEDGCAVGTAPANQELVLVGQVQGAVSEPVDFETGKATEDSKACGKPDALVVKDAAASECPAGFIACDSACLDPVAGQTMCSPDQPEPDAGAPGDGGVDGVTDPAPNLNTPGETRCDTCPDTNITDFELEVGAVSTTTLSGVVTGAEGNGQFYVVGADGAAIQGTIPTDPTTGSYSVALPLFCGEQTVKLLWTNSAGETVAVLKVITTDCTDADIRVTLTWDDKGDDFELHLIRQGGTINDGKNDCTWTSCIGSGPDWGTASDTADNPLKDVDNTGNYGPENIILSMPEETTYTVMVEHWSSSGLPDADGQVIINVKGFGSTIIDITNLAPSHVFTAATVSWPSGVVTKIGTDFDCTSNWSGGCKEPIP